MGVALDGVNGRFRGVEVDDLTCWREEIRTIMAVQPNWINGIDLFGEKQLLSWDFIMQTDYYHTTNTMSTRHWRVVTIREIPVACRTR